jgi:adenylate cyclase
LTAVECALECRRRVRDLSDQRKKQELETLKVGYTLNSGDAVAGHFGSEQRQDYSVIGDMVNTCARIEKFVEGDGILVGQNTYTLVRDDVRAEKKPVRSVKGKEQVVHVYEILELLEE